MVTRLSDDRSPQAVPDEGAASPRLQDVIAEHQATRRTVESLWGSAWACVCGEPHSPQHVAAAWREACTIRTLAQLDALPTQSAVRTAYGEILERAAGGWTAGDDVVWPAVKWLPALLVWNPDWDAL
jgi:hypothetical protein